MQYLTVEAKQVQVGDEIENTHADGPAFRWVRVTSVERREVNPGAARTARAPCVFPPSPEAHRDTKETSMGWDYTRKTTKAEMVAMLVAPVPRRRETAWDNQNGRTVELDYDVEAATLAHKVCGNELWCVVEVGYSRGGEVFERKRQIILFLCDGRGGNWGYKGMSEECHPYYYRCPPAFLDMAPETCPAWRAKVREQAAAKVAG
jgi:hypothetical protein